MASDILNLPNCGGADSTFNSGYALCDVIRKAPKGLLLHDSGVEYDLAERESIATLVAAIKEDTRAPRGARVYPILALVNFEDTSTEPTKAAVGNLSIAEITMQEGVPSFVFQHRKGDLYHRELTRAQNANLKLMIIDDAYVLYGTKTAGGNLTGYSLSEFYVQLAKFATASEPSKYPFNVVLESIIEYKENLAIVQLDATIFNISGNVSVDLNTPGAPMVQAANVANITPIALGGKNIGLTWPTQLAMVGAWKVTNAQTGAVAPPTTVAWDTAKQWFIVTTNATAFGALTAGEKQYVDLATCAELAALGVDGFESLGPVTMVKP